MASISQLLGRLTRTPEELRAETCREWASSVPGTTRIGDIETRRHQKAAGVVQNIRIDPREGSGSIEVTISDGTGYLVAKWLGRQSLSGIGLGTGLVVNGIAGRSSDGELVILNPEYELVPHPEQG
ncbi:MAG: hypothetical protein M3280_12295 [Actinomycetota bacterium]|nr:hypothetical protein [Actinomycetota bacterium]